jgi:hypothetical protein
MHSKGKWRVMTKSDNGQIGGCCEDGCEYNGLAAGRGYAPYGFCLTGFVNKEDVTLMAAAPEMLALLKEIVESGEIPYCESSPLVIKAKALIERVDTSPHVG